MTLALIAAVIVGLIWGFPAALLTFLIIILLNEHD